ncbi:MAG: RluA family pseudouridine synthase [Flavobacteriales bacterium]|nr:RluA family pseudouridine synthase [Flavobacteriales bacterium]
MLEVLFEDNHIIIVNKKSGEITQGDKTGDTPLSEKVKEYIKHKYNKPGNVFIGTVHRLDRPVTGVIVFAKTSKALTRLNKMFQDKKMQKTYWALCSQAPKVKHQKLSHYLVKDTQKNKTKAHLREIPNGKKSELIYTHLKNNKLKNLIEVKPLTGRPHQIRVQLSSMGCSILGDLKYGANKPNPDKSICLHARNIEFIHPVSKEVINVTAPLPNHNWK